MISFASMLSKAQNKHIRSLSLQKFRNEHHQFLVEGDKIVREWLTSNADINFIIGLEDWMLENESFINLHPNAQIIIVDETELKTISALQTPNRVLAVVRMSVESKELPIDEWTIVLEHLQDPGNMGTIIRIADWFGIGHIVCSKDCVDVYNPKVIQAAMGSHLRMQFHIADLQDFLPKIKIPILAATLNGNDMNQLPPLEKAMLMIGNESKGLSQQLIQLATHQVTIARKGSAESLNAAVATGILCAHFIR